MALFNNTYFDDDELLPGLTPAKGDSTKMVRMPESEIQEQVDALAAGTFPGMSVVPGPQSGAIDLDNATMMALTGVGLGVRMGQGLIGAVADEATMGASSLIKGGVKAAKGLFNIDPEYTIQAIESVGPLPGYVNIKPKRVKKIAQSMDRGTGSYTYGVKEEGDFFYINKDQSQHKEGFVDFSVEMNQAYPEIMPTYESALIKKKSGDVTNLQAQKKAAGQSMRTADASVFENVTQAQLDRGMDVVGGSASKGTYYDIVGGMTDNVFYDPAKGFQFIDIGKYGKGYIDEIGIDATIHQREFANNFVQSVRKANNLKSAEEAVEWMKLRGLSFDNSIVPWFK